MAAAAGEGWTAGFLATKHSWRGKYRRLLLVGPASLATLNPLTLEETNHVRRIDGSNRV